MHANMNKECYQILIFVLEAPGFIFYNSIFQKCSEMLRIHIRTDMGKGFIIHRFSLSITWPSATVHDVDNCMAALKRKEAKAKERCDLPFCVARRGPLRHSDVSTGIVSSDKRDTSTILKPIWSLGDSWQAKYLRQVHVDVHFSRGRCNSLAVRAHEMRCWVALVLRAILRGRHSFGEIAGVRRLHFYGTHCTLYTPHFMLGTLHPKRHTGFIAWYSNRQKYTRLQNGFHIYQIVWSCKSVITMMCIRVRCFYWVFACYLV